MDIINQTINTFLSLTLICSVALADASTVTFTDSATGQTGQLSGIIEQYNRNELLLKTPSGQVKSIKTSNIVKIDANRPASYLEALLRIQRNEYELSLPLLQKAYTETSDTYVRDEILAKQVEVLFKMGKLQAAIEKYCKLSTNSDSVFYDTVPLVWTSIDPSPVVLENSQRYLSQQKNPFVSLMGASILLTTNKKAMAQTALNILRQSDDSVIATLAQMQLHRLTLTPLPVSDIKKLESQVDLLPKSLQYGPRFILAQLWSRSSVEKLIKTDKVSMNYLQCAKNDNSPLELQARCLYSAGNTLLEAGYKDEAFRIFTYLIQKYPNSSWTDQAKRTAGGSL